MNTTIPMSDTTNDPADETSTRWLGECQICEREQKLVARSLLLVHHGYARPGHGSIVGDCPGVGYDAYENSCERLKAYRTDLARQLEVRCARLTSLREGTAQTITRVKSRGTRTRHTEFETLERDSADPVAWSQAVRYAISEIESDTRALEREIERASRRIARWSPKPLRSVEEAVRHEDGQKAARAAARAQARFERAVKAAAIVAKQKELAERRAAIKRGFVFRIRELAASSEPLAERQEAARRVGLELRKTKYSWLALYELDIDQELLTLKLAHVVGTKPNGKPYVRYFHPFGAA